MSFEPRNGGYGFSAYGRSNFGNAESEVEPRFDVSDPADGSVDVSIYKTTVVFDVYLFSSTAISDDTLLIEVSENGGISYSNVYANGSFVVPFMGSRSRIDFQEADPQKMRVWIHKTSPWANDVEIRVRVTVADEFGNEATKETPIKWG